MMEKIMECFTSGGFGDVECIISQGFGDMFGSPIFSVLFVFILIILMSKYLKLTTDLTILFGIGMMYALSFAFLPTWGLWVALITSFAIAGYGFYRWVSRR